jgi:hypothetical protein
MDWITAFSSSFKDDPELKELMKKRVHGSIQINFCAGVPVNYNLTIHKRASNSNKGEEHGGSTQA